MTCMSHSIPKENVYFLLPETTFSGGDPQVNFTIPEKWMLLETAGREDRKKEWKTRKADKKTERDIS